MCLGFAEAALRVVAWREDRVRFEEVFRAELPTLAPGREAKLAHVIRPARHPGIVYELRPNLRVRFAHGSQVTTDARGFRSHGDVSAATGGPAVFRIVGLGDSFMFGQGVSDGEPYLSIVARELATESAGLEPRYEVLNTAVPGYNTWMEVSTLEAKALDPPPDLVLVHFVGNDLELPNFIRERRPVASLSRSFLVDFVQDRLAMAPAPAPREPGALGVLRDAGLVAAPRGETVGFERDARRVPEVYRHMVGRDGFAGALDRLAELRSRHGFEVVVFTSAERAGPSRRVLSAARERGFHALDVGPHIARTLEEQGHARFLDSPLAASETDGHFSAQGHALTAGVLLAYLRAEGLLARARP